MDRFSAELMEGKTADLQPVTVAVVMAALELREAATDRVIGHWPLKGLDVERLGGGTLHLRHERAPSALLTSDDPGLALALRQMKVRGLPRGRRLLTVGAVLVTSLAALIGVGYAALPAVSQSLARRVPLDVEDHLGLQLSSVLEKSRCDGAGAQTALDDLTARLTTADLDGQRPRWVSIVDWDMVNAFTLPGGRVAVTRGLVASAESPDEVAGVLAHELEHVRRRHVMAQMIRTSILSLGWAATVGDFSGFFAIDPSTVLVVARQRFSRDDEREADAGALTRLDAAGISRVGLARFFQRLENEHGDGVPWLSTHPPTSARIRAIDAERSPTPAGPALAARQWAAIKHACDGRPPRRPGDAHGDPPPEPPGER